MTFTVPYPDPESSRQTVANGLALLEYVDWDRKRVQNCVVADLDNFDMNDCQHCALGMTIGWVDGHTEFETVCQQLNLGWDRFDVLFGFDAWNGHGVDELQRAWLDALGLTHDYERLHEGDS